MTSSSVQLESHFRVARALATSSQQWKIISEADNQGRCWKKKNAKHTQISGHLCVCCCSGLIHSYFGGGRQAAVGRESFFPPAAEPRRKRCSRSPCSAPQGTEIHKCNLLHGRQQRDAAAATAGRQPPWLKPRHLTRGCRRFGCRSDDVKSLCGALDPLLRRRRRRVLSSIQLFQVLQLLWFRNFVTDKGALLLQLLHK